MSSASEVMEASVILLNTVKNIEEHDRAIISFTIFTFLIQLALLVSRWSRCSRACAVRLRKCAAIYVANGCSVSCSAAGPSAYCSDADWVGMLLHIVCALAPRLSQLLVFVVYRIAPRKT